MKKIAVVTATRAEYGLLAPVVRELRKYEDADSNSNFDFINSTTLKVDLIVTGTHLSEAYGMTIDEIQERIDKKIVISVKSENSLDISKNQAETLVKFTELFQTEQYNAVLLLGDRYETLAIAIAAGNTRTPIFHLCGGDTTEGAMDEWIRHSITKMAYLHFVTNEESRKRVIQLGEAPKRVFNYGSTSIDNILANDDMDWREALDSLGLGKIRHKKERTHSKVECKTEDGYSKNGHEYEMENTYFCECGHAKNSIEKNCDELAEDQEDMCEHRYALCTYHPVTMENGTVDEQIEQFLEAIKAFPEIEFIVTKSNADQGGARINELLDMAETKIQNLHVFTSLGTKRYLALMRHAEFVLGNSSSGIVETPAFHIPTVNIGDRQKGRLQSESTVNCGTDAADIIAAIKVALSEEHRALCKTVVSPYGDGHAAVRIAKKTVETVMNGEIDLKKKFYDLSF